MSPSPISANKCCNKNNKNKEKYEISPESEHEDVKKKFNNFWPQLLREIQNDPEFQNTPHALEWLNTVMEKNVPMGKQTRALAFIHVYNQLAIDECKRESEKIQMIFGWVIEIVQTAALMADDIMDGSETRRGVKCWYKENNVGLSAVNDSFLLENLAYFIMYKYFGQKSYFPKLLALIHNIAMKTIMGQCMDTRFSLNVNLNDFTLENYKTIVKYKTSYYTFYFPIAAALIMAYYKDESIYNTARDVILKMGYLFQVQDDFLDCYGDPNETGKIGTDIIDGKCSWLIVMALELVEDSQRKVLEDCYGKKNEEKERRVKMIYDDLDIESHYRAFERQIYMETFNLIKEMPECLPKPSFQHILNKMYKRSK